MVTRFLVASKNEVEVLWEGQLRLQVQVCKQELPEA